MSDSNFTDAEILEIQIRQLREAEAALENRNSGAPGIKPEEMWTFMQQKMDNDTPIHPRLHGIFTGHVELDEVQRNLKRLENDLRDLKNVNESEELYDPMRHDIDTESTEEFAHLEKEDEEKVDSEESPAMRRDKNQRPLSAYQNSTDS